MNIPATIFVEINPEDIPPGPQGASAYQSWLAVGHQGTEADFLAWLQQTSTPSIVPAAVSVASIPPGTNTASTEYVSTGLKKTVEAFAGQRVLIDVRGVVSHTAQNIVHFTVRRNGVDLAGGSLTGLAVVRVDVTDCVRSLSLLHEDTVPQAGPVTYELFWRCHNLGAAWLGRRAADAAMMVPTVLALTVL